MRPSIEVRAPRSLDVPALAQAHVDIWRETYRGLMRDEILDAPDFLLRRHRFWDAALSDPRYGRNKTALAECDGQVIGIAMSGPPTDDDATWSTQLYVLYVYAAFHGVGAGAALLNAVSDPSTSAALWVADPNPRAQRFYRNHGFRADGATKTAEGIHEIRMVRPGRPTTIER